MELETERLLLRELDDGDLDDLVRLADNLNVSRYLAVVPHPYLEEDGDWYITDCKKKAKQDPRKNFSLAIIRKSDQQFLGCIGLSSVDYYTKSATLGYWLGEPYWRKGYMYEAVRRIIEFAFFELGLIRINVEAYTENVGSNALLEKVGATYEGLRRQYSRTKSTGDFMDAHIYGILRENYVKD